MSHKLNIEMSDRAFDAIVREADTLGTTPAAIASSELERRFADGNGSAARELTEVEIDEARLRFEHHFGEASLPGVVLSDNEQIDADLAREYGSTHETS